jgi:hypothetical protein
MIRRILPALAIVLMIWIYPSCKKEECANCFIEQTDTTTATVDTLDMGEICGEELENTDGSTFTGSTGPGRRFCDR